jgi:hypothetical protein
MSDIGLDLSGVIAFLFLAACAIVLLVIAVILLAVASIRNAPSRPLKADRIYQHAWGAGAMALLSMVAAVWMGWVANEKALAPETLTRCDEFSWLWLAVVALGWRAMVSVVGARINPPVHDDSQLPGSANF